MAQAYLTKKLLQVRACDLTRGFQIEHVAKTRGLLLCTHCWMSFLESTGCMEIV